jgi:hypothetical protein
MEVAMEVGSEAAREAVAIHAAAWTNGTARLTRRTAVSTREEA